MKLFKPMSLEEARKFYEELRQIKNNHLVAIAMDDIYFFTNGLTKDY